MEIINNFVLPLVTRGGNKGSSYFPADVKATMERLGLNQGFAWTIPTGMDSKKAKANCAYYAKEHFKGTQKEFGFALNADGTALLIKCLNVPIVADSAAEPAVNGAVETPAEQPAAENKPEAPAKPVNGAK